MRHGLLLLAVASCGRFGFGENSDGKRTVPRDGASDSVDSPDAAIVPFVPYWTSGSRIRARIMVVGDGGDPIWYGWRDTATNTDCTDGVASDGMERCMPQHARADQFYADGACANRLAWVHGLCGQDAYGEFTTTGNVIHAVPITGVYSGPVYDSSCQPTSAPTTGQLYSTGAEVAPTTFAQIHYTKPQVGNYIHVQYGWGDGSLFDLGALSFSQGSCNPTGGMLSGTTGCRPNGDSSLVPVYSEGTCMQRAFYSAAGDIPSEFIVDNTTLCGQSFQVYNVVANITAANYWTLGPSGCAMQTTGTGTLFTAVAVDPYPHGVLSVTTRRGRIGHLTWTADDGIAIPIAEYDEDLGRTCRPFIADDGVVRCLPRSPKTADVSRDGTCLSAPVSTAADCYGLDPVDGVGYASCDDGPISMHSLASIAATSLQDEATCKSLGSGFDPAATTGGIPATTFVQLTHMIE